MFEDYIESYQEMGIQTWNEKQVKHVYYFLTATENFMSNSCSCPIHNDHLKTFV